MSAVRRIHRLTTGAHRGLTRGLRTGLRRGGRAWAAYRHDPEAVEQLIRAVAGGGALLAALLRRRAGHGVSDYRRDRASAEQLIRDLSALAALLAVVLRRPSPAEPVTGEVCPPAGSTTPDVDRRMAKTSATDPKI